MIVVEKQLDLAFSTLPEVGGKKPVYKWGNETHLKQLLVAYQKGNELPYPLIYQVSNSSNQDAYHNETEARLSLVIATRNENLSQLNENRWAITYNDILYPVVRNIETLFIQGSIFSVWNKKYTLSTFPNYSARDSGDENGTIDIWDAVRFDTTITINNKECINQILY